MSSDATREAPGPSARRGWARSLCAIASSRRRRSRAIRRTERSATSWWTFIAGSLPAGSAMSTVAYCAVAPGGRVNRHCLVMEPGSIPGLRRLTDAIHAEGAAAIGAARTCRASSPTCAPTARPRSLRPPASARPRAGASRARRSSSWRRSRPTTCAPRRPRSKPVSMRIELHLGHNYLLSSFFSPNLNKRTDRYGGDVESRSRFPREVVTAVREAVGDRLAVIAKFNMADGVEGGLWLDESLPIAQLLQDDGALDALVLTGGSSLLNGMYFFRGDVPLAEMVESQPKLVGLGPAARRPRACSRATRSRKASSCPSPASFALGSPCRSSCSAGSTGSTPCSTRSTKASPSCRWAGRCCASPTCCARCRRVSATRGCACTATSACRRSTRVRVRARTPAGLRWAGAGVPAAAQGQPASTRSAPSRTSAARSGPLRIAAFHPGARAFGGVGGAHQQQVVAALAADRPRRARGRPRAGAWRARAMRARRRGPCRAPSRARRAAPRRRAAPVRPGPA